MHRDHVKRVRNDMVGSMVWPAGGSGGIPGDIVATLIWVILRAIITVLAWPPLRRLLWKVLGLHALHAKLDHIILEHPSIANEIPGLEAQYQPSVRRCPALRRHHRQPRRTHRADFFVTPLQ